MRCAEEEVKMQRNAMDLWVETMILQIPVTSYDDPSTDGVVVVVMVVVLVVVVV